MSTQAAAVVCCADGSTALSLSNHIVCIREFRLQSSRCLFHYLLLFTLRLEFYRDAFLMASWHGRCRCERPRSCFKYAPGLRAVAIAKRIAAAWKTGRAAHFLWAKYAFLIALRRRAMGAYAHRDCETHMPLDAGLQRRLSSPQFYAGAFV